MKNEIEIMSPVGSYESLMAAIQAGAGSVYFGVGKMNMRSRSTVNFTEEDLQNITGICASHGVSSYLTLNTVIYNEEIEEVKRMLSLAGREGISAVIASDWAVIRQAREMGLEVHISTQCNVTNLEAVRFFSQFAEVMVLGREVPLNQVAGITEAIRQQDIRGPGGKPVRIEMFAHGALCMAVSGKCYLSLDHFNASANRGACLQPCRRGYLVKDQDQEVELAIENQYIMSPKDLCTIGILDKIVKAGVSVLKIEGRGRSAEYVKVVTRCYREALASIQEGSYSREKVENWTERLRSVYNRGFWEGYYLGRKMGEWSDRYGSQATRVKRYVGKITNYFGQLGVAEIGLETGKIAVGDSLLVIGSTTGVYEMELLEIRVDLKPVPQAVKGECCSIKTDQLVRRGDKVYVWEKTTEEF